MDNPANTTGVPFAIGVLCVPDAGAARRVSALAIEEDSGAPLALPADFLPEGATPQYGAILAGLRRMQCRACLESATYRIATDGRFIHRTIETERNKYFFRTAAHDEQEPPYAVLYKLS
jgi:hypothetical protein